MVRAVSTGRAEALQQQVQAQLRQVFGLRRLRPGQRDVIDRALRGQSTLAVMPTGAGKSLCYQLPATLLEGITVVVSPLIALMQDQCDKLQQLGVAAVQLNSAVDAEQAAAAEQAIGDGTARIAFVTPERLVEPGFMALLAQRHIGLLVVDEAHCISHWGHDFRPAFTEVGTMLPALGSPPVLALTATASDEVTADIARQLCIPAAGVLTGSSYRPNLHFSVETLNDEAAKLRRTIELCAQEPGSAIVYTATVKAAEAVHAALREAGLPAGLYHGQLRVAERQAAQQAFMAGESDGGRLMVATNAFGLGIDKADIRLVLHYQLPAGLDVYYQEAGRAGRDGAPSRCKLLYLASDRAVQQFFLNSRYPTVDDGLKLLATLDTDSGGEPWTLARLKERLQRPSTKLRVLLNLMRRQRWLDLDARGGVHVRDGAAAMDGIGALLSRYVEKSEQDQERLEQVVYYAQTGGCRWRTLLEAFEEPPLFQRCGSCDNCRRMLAFESDAARDEPAPAARPALSATAAAIAAATAGSMPPVPSVAPVPASGPRFQAGDAVRVRRYGAGIVTEATADAVTVDFGGKQRRSFHPDFVRPGRAAAAASA
jgi:ATP-dependent DNA helicase RecQ